MSISVYKTFASGEILTAADLNASFTQVTNNGTDVAFPLTKAVSFAGFSVAFDASSTRSMVDSAKGQNLTATAFNDTKTTVASAATPDIWTSTGRLIDYTGTVTATGFAAASQAGASRVLLCAAAAPFTAGANMLIDGYASGQTFTAAAGDTVDVIAVTTTQFRLKPRLATAAAAIVPIVNDFRLTLSTGVAVTTSDVTGATTVYAAPLAGNRISLFDGARWNVRTSSEFSLALGTLTSGLPYDVFCYDNSGVPTLEFTAWTNTTTRATALTTQDGVYVKTGALTRRYLGTFYTTSTTQTEDSFAKRFLWNYYHRRRRGMRVIEATDNWNYTTHTIRQANGSTANQLDFVIGVSEDLVSAEVHATAFNTSAGVQIWVGIGVDSTSTFTASQLYFSGETHVTSNTQAVDASYKAYSAVGRHFWSWNEDSLASGTTTWSGDATGLSQSGIHGELWG